jgi:hypothetical protein
MSRIGQSSARLSRVGGKVLILLLTLPAFYHVRMIEIPTPRWSANDAKYLDTELLPGTPMTVTERAYTSLSGYKRKMVGWRAP